jgi:hypothetical protein
MQQRLVQPAKLVTSLISSSLSLLRRILTRSTSNEMPQRRINLLKQVDFLIDTLSMSKLDILYMENLKMPLAPDERIYFTQQIDRINSALKILLWMRHNIETNQKFWKKFLHWG